MQSGRASNELEYVGLNQDWASEGSVAEALLGVCTYSVTFSPPHLEMVRIPENCVLCSESCGLCINSRHFYAAFQASLKDCVPFLK